MSTYNRATIFAALNGSPLPGDTLDDEFNAIQTATNDTYSRLQRLEGTGRAIVVHAADEAYAPIGTESNATRVKNAIVAAEAVGADAAVVYVPRSMWGYCANGDFDFTMFDTGVFLVREGSLGPWYDPVAYGADTSGTADSFRSIDAAFAGAGSGDSNMKAVAFTVPGTYKKGTDVDRRSCVVLTGAGVTASGAGTFTGTVAWQLDGIFNTATGLIAARPVSGTRAGHAYFSTDSFKLDVWDGAAWQRINPDATTTEAAFSFNPAGSAGSKATAVVLTKRLHLHVVATSTSSDGKLVVDFSDTSFAGAYDLAKLHTVVASERGSSGPAIENTRIVVDATAQTVTLNLDGSTQTAEWDLLLTFHT